MRACRDCGAGVTAKSSLAVRCAECQAEYKRARRRDLAKEKRGPRPPCKGCGGRIEDDRYPNATLCYDCRYRQRLEAGARHDSKRVGRFRGLRRFKPIFLRVPDDSDFDRWLAGTILNPPKPLPVLHLEAEAWRPFTVPDYLK